MFCYMRMEQQVGGWGKAKVWLLDPAPDGFGPSVRGGLIYRFIGLWWGWVLLVQRFVYGWILLVMKQEDVGMV